MYRLGQRIATTAVGAAATASQATTPNAECRAAHPSAVCQSQAQSVVLRPTSCGEWTLADLIQNSADPLGNDELDEAADEVEQMIKNNLESYGTNYTVTEPDDEQRSNIVAHELPHVAQLQSIMRLSRAMAGDDVIQTRMRELLQSPDAEGILLGDFKAQPLLCAGPSSQLYDTLSQHSPRFSEDEQNPLEHLLHAIQDHFAKLGAKIGLFFSWIGGKIRQSVSQSNDGEPEDMRMRQQDTVIGVLVNLVVLIIVSAVVNRKGGRSTSTA